MRHHVWSLALLAILALEHGVAANSPFTGTHVYGEYGQVYPEDAFHVPNTPAARCNPGQMCPEDAQLLAGRFNTPLSVAIGPAGQLVVADSFNHRVQVFGADGGHQLTIGGLGSRGVPDREVPIVPGFPGDVLDPLTNATVPRLFYPTGVGVDAAGRIVVADNWNHRVIVYNPDGSVFSVVGDYADARGGGPEAALGRFAYPYRVALRAGTRLGDPMDTSGRLYVLDQGNHRVQVFGADLTPLAAFGGPEAYGFESGRFYYPNDLTYDNLRDQVLVTDGNNGRVHVFTAGGAFKFMFGGDLLGTPLATVVDADGRIFVVDKSDRVRVFAQDGSAVRHLFDFGRPGPSLGEINYACGIASADNGRIVIADTDNHRIQVFEETRAADTTAPVSTATLRHAPNVHGWVNTAQGVTFTATDVGEGVDTIVVDPAVPEGPEAQVAPGTELTFPEGVSVIDYYAVDRAGNREMPKRLEIRVDTTAPAVTCGPSASIVWPPNHKLVPVAFTVTAADPVSGSTGFVLASATSSEPDRGREQGDQPHDLQGWSIGTADTSGFVRAERSGTGPGRVYTFSFESRDRAGNVAACQVTTRVPRAQGSPNR